MRPSGSGVLGAALRCALNSGISNEPEEDDFIERERHVVWQVDNPRLAHGRIFRRGRCPGVHRVSENPGGSRLMNPLRSPGLHYRIAAARDRITELRVGAGGYTPRENRRSRPAASRTKPRSTDLRRRGVTLLLRRKLVDAFARSRSGQRALRCVRRSASRPVAVPESLLMGSWRTGRVSGSAWWRQRP